MNEKLANFERLAEKRMTEALKKIRLVANLSNKNNYDYTEKHVSQIISKLEEEVSILKQKFRTEIKNDETNFSFKR
jgi:formiminotetrahydrofolate cyclodeaminase